MNKADLGIIGLGLLTGLVLLAFVTYEAYGYDYYKPYGSIWTHSPIICLDSVSKNQTYNAIKATHEWDKSFNMRGVDKYDYKIVLTYVGDKILSLDRICDVLVMPVQIEESLGKNGLAIGTAICSNYKILNINVACVVKIKYAHEYWYSTLTHEIGHTLGMGHISSYNATDYIGVVMSRDIMLDTGNQWMRINPSTLDALDYFYAGAGFNNNIVKFIPANYTVPHEEVHEIQNRYRN